MTRFNIKVGFSPSSLGNDINWLEHRFELFDNYCFPSVYSQSNQSFKWIVFFDAETPEKFKIKISKYAEWSNFIPIYIVGSLTQNKCREIVSRYLDSTTTHLISTRLDNDDAICNTYIQEIQSRFNNQEFEFVSFMRGYVFKDKKLYLFFYKSNPFISLFEKINELSDFRTVLCVKHTEIYSLGKVLEIHTPPGWLQVVHGRNVLNRTRGVRHPITAISENFKLNIPIPTQKEGFVSFFFDYAVSLVKLPIDSLATKIPDSFKDIIRKLTRK